MKCLALDVGSSSIKGAVLDVARSGISHITTKPFPPPIPGLPPRFFEVDPQAIEDAARSVLQSLLLIAPDAELLFVAGQMGGLLMLGPDGEPRTNYLSWRDQRSLSCEVQGKDLVRWIREQLDEETYTSLGRELQAGSTPTLLCWLIQQRAIPADATPVTVGDYLVSRLCSTQGQMHVTHAIGLLDLRTFGWHREAFRRVGLGDVEWPKLVQHVEPAGSCRLRDRELQVFGAYGDQQCALLGAGLQRQELSINASTGSQVSRRVDAFQAGDFQTRAYFDGDLLQTITHIPAGRSLNVLLDLLTELATVEGLKLRDPWGEVSRLVGECTTVNKHAAAGLSVDLAFFAGPFGSSGSISGITTENLSVGTLFEAAFQSMAANYARCAERLDPTRRWERIALSGSLPRSLPRLRQAIEAQFDKPFRDASDEEETLLGLLRLATRTATSHG